MTGPDPRSFLARAYAPETYVYNIDIVGTCNLACASCPVGNTPAGPGGGRPARGHMSVEHFAAILAKIVAEAPVGRPAIALYNWGEPLLHPDIGRIVGLVRDRGLYCAVSTNLNHVRYLEDLVVARPSNIKVSLSGFTQAVYGRTHTRGDIERVKTNLRWLRELLDRHAVQTDVFIGYHEYRDNDGAELDAMTSLARELGFGIRHKIARLYPLEKLLPLAAGASPVPSDRALHDLLLVRPSEWAAAAKAKGATTACVMRDQETTINFDGSVALCCNVFDYAHNVAPRFLDVGHDAIAAAKAAHPLCGPCMASGFPTSCGLDADAGIQAIAASRRLAAVASA